MKNEPQAQMLKFELSQLISQINLAKDDKGAADDFKEDYIKIKDEMEDIADHAIKEHHAFLDEWQYQKISFFSCVFMIAIYVISALYVLNSLKKEGNDSNYKMTLSKVRSQLNNRRLTFLILVAFVLSFCLKVYGFVMEIFVPHMYGGHVGEWHLVRLSEQLNIMIVAFIGGIGIPTHLAVQLGGFRDLAQIKNGLKPTMSNYQHQMNSMESLLSTILVLTMSVVLL